MTFVLPQRLNADAISPTRLPVAGIWRANVSVLLALMVSEFACLIINASEIDSGPTNSHHWAFQPVRSQPAPGVRSNKLVRTPIDNFILAKLEERGLPPAAPADKRTLIRRATFDLIGLPPTPEEVAEFLADKSPASISKVIDRLLNSPRYGERWGRHWMDVVRYADTAGDNADYPIPEISLYRDYIIDAFNADMPFDQFAQEQLAGDILADRQPGGRRAEQIVATGFLALSRRYGTGPYELWHLTLENTIETVGQAFLGLNLKCARCHDHKFDPLTMRDYYGLYGVFASTEFPWAGSEEIASKNFNRQKFIPLAPEAEASPKWRDWESRLKLLREQIATLEKVKPADKPLADEQNKKIASLKKELRTLEKPGAPPDMPVAYAVREGKAADVAIQRRGEPADPGPVVPRCVPEVLAGQNSLHIAPNASGRLEFARWLTRPDNPLTARVMANRIWQHHFSQGLVTTPNNLGLRGNVPVHRELLDYLAQHFVESGWSVKAMHRLIMNSAVYQQSSDENPSNRRVDPANRYLWHFERQRLEAEAIRDAMLFASGELDLTRPGPHPFPPPEKWTWTQHAPFKERYDTKHRSVYLMTQRLQKHPFLALFDGPDTNNSAELRRASTVPQQALFAMNNPFVDEQSRALARRVMRERSTVSDRIRRLHELAWSRSPSRAEARKCEQWLTKATALAGTAGDSEDRRENESWTSLARVLLTANEFFYVD
ncbi:MAG: DUF1553 domain-containing protein [Pedosphaera sp.]|nr:DUF1553 domain-containing protein [Pedosphaera sp.]